MKNRVASALALASVLVILAASNAQAQISKLVVSVPFDFTAGKTTLKAGKYSIKQFNGSSLLIKNGDGTSALLVSAPIAIGSEKPKAGERLVFNRYGDQYFLSQIWLRADRGRQIYPSQEEQKTAREFELANRSVRPERVEIAIRTNE